MHIVWGSQVLEFLINRPTTSNKKLSNSNGTNSPWARPDIGTNLVAISIIDFLKGTFHGILFLIRRSKSKVMKSE